MAQQDSRDEFPYVATVLVLRCGGVVGVMRGASVDSRPGHRCVPTPDPRCAYADPMELIVLILLVVAVVLFGLAAVGVAGRFNLVAAGLMIVALAAAAAWGSQMGAL